MKIKWLGHASFLLTFENGVKIITDPYKTGDGISYAPIDEAADIVTISHDHGDHNNTGAVRGKPQIIRGNADIKGINIKAVPTFHDDTGGSQRGKNTIFCFSGEGLNVCHLGDLGHTLSEVQISSLGNIDIMMIPVGGYYTIDAKTATIIGDSLKPSVIIPMHFKNDRCQYPITGVEEFLAGKINVERPGTSEVAFRPGEMPVDTGIIVLEPSL